MFEHITEMISGLEEYPVFTTILVAFIGLIGIVVTQIIIHINAEYDKKRERITDYIGSLRLQVLCTHDRLALLRARRIEAGMEDAKKNSIKFIDGKEVKCYSDIQSDIAAMEWCYHEGFNLCSICYLLACLIAQCYRTKQHLEILRLSKKRLNKLTDYLLKIEGIFDEHFGVWQVMQYDIALAMMDNDQMISFGDFCRLAKEEPCFVQLFDFYLSIADYGRRTQELDLIIVLYDFYYFLERIAYPSVLKALAFYLSTSFLRKHLFLYVRKARFQREMDTEEMKPEEEGAKEGNAGEGKDESETQKNHERQEKTNSTENADLKKAAELERYLYTGYQENKEKKKKQEREKKRERFFLSYYDIAIQPISSYVVMEGLKEKYKKRPVK